MTTAENPKRLPDQVAITVLPEDLDLAVKQLKEHTAVNLCTSCVIWQAINRQHPGLKELSVGFSRFRFLEDGFKYYYMADEPDLPKMGAITTLSEDRLCQRSEIEGIRANLPLTLNFTRFAKHEHN